MATRSPLRGFNHNVRHGSRLFHVQTEDSGVDRPHLFTHLYFGGIIIASARTDYAELATQPNHETAVRKLMQDQHKTLMKQLRHGLFDAKILELLGEASESAPHHAAAPAQLDGSEPAQSTIESAPQALFTADAPQPTGDIQPPEVASQPPQFNPPPVVVEPAPLVAVEPLAPIPATALGTTPPPIPAAASPSGWTSTTAPSDAAVPLPTAPSDAAVPLLTKVPLATPAPPLASIVAAALPSTEIVLAPLPSAEHQLPPLHRKQYTAEFQPRSATEPDHPALAQAPDEPNLPASHVPMGSALAASPQAAPPQAHTPAWMAPDTPAQRQQRQRVPIMPVASQVFSAPTAALRGPLGIEDALERAGGTTAGPSAVVELPTGLEISSTAAQHLPALGETTLFDNPQHAVLNGTVRTPHLADRVPPPVADGAPLTSRPQALPPLVAPEELLSTDPNEILAPEEEPTDLTRPARQSGVYSLPNWARASSPYAPGHRPMGQGSAFRVPNTAPDSVARPVSTPQRYVAPSARGAQAPIAQALQPATRPRRKTGSYAAAGEDIPASSTPATTPQASGWAAGPTTRRAAVSGVYDVNLRGMRAAKDATAAAEHSQGVIARPAVIIDRNAGAASAAPNRQGTQQRLPAAAHAQPPRQVAPAYAAGPVSAAAGGAIAGNLPRRAGGATANTAPPAASSQGTEPSGSERSLDEVILQYLSEDGEANRNKKP